MFLKTIFSFHNEDAETQQSHSLPKTGKLTAENVDQSKESKVNCLPTIRVSNVASQSLTQMPEVSLINGT